MKTNLWLLLCIALVSGCADLKASMREKECSSDCPNFNAEQYKDGYQKGSARRARPPV